MTHTSSSYPTMCDRVARNDFVYSVYSVYSVFCQVDHRVTADRMPVPKNGIRSIRSATNIIKHLGAAATTSQCDPLGAPFEPLARGSERGVYAVAMGSSLYSTRRWLALRAQHLRREPLCRFCVQQGLVTVGTIVDHIRPHRGNVEMFFDDGNLQTLCTPHHNSTKQRAELNEGLTGGCTLAGWPVDTRHPWNGGSTSPPKRTPNKNTRVKEEEKS